MPKPYQPAVFQPTIRPSWAGSFEYISSEELSQILKAITVFPNADVPDSAFWNQTVKPDLEQQYQNFINTCEKRGRGARTYWGEHKLSLSYTYDNHKNTISITQGNLCKDKDKNKDKDNKGGVGGKRETIDENTPFKAGGQMWTMPLQFRKLAKKYWAESEIREIEIEHSCHEEPVELTINDLLTIKPPKPKKKDFVPPTLEEWLDYCREKGLKQQRMIEAYEGYACAGWKDSRGNPVRNWKQKILNVWCKDENRETFPMKQKTL